MKATRSIFAISFFLVVGFGGGFIAGTSGSFAGISGADQGKPQSVDFSLFWDAWKEVQKNYVDASSLDQQKMVYGAIKGMVESIGDPYTQFMDPEEAKKFREDVAGSFEGVGMELGIRNEDLTVIAPLSGTPAEKSGIRAGDIVWKIDDTPTKGMSVDQAVERIRGPKGTTVALSILRGASAEQKEFAVERAVIDIPSVKWETGDNGIAHVRIFQFSAKTGQDFERIASQTDAKKLKGIVLDLRNNPGGLLEVSRDIAGWFLDKGATVVIEDFGEKRDPIVYRANGPSGFSLVPMVVLINKGSASASEILAGALRDNRAIPLVGETSFGKGSVQELEDLKQSSSLKITIAKWLTPNRAAIMGVGLTPDVLVELTDQDVKEEKDPQFDKAVEILLKM